jgi:hypothetical protein
MGFNSVFKGLRYKDTLKMELVTISNAFFLSYRTTRRHELEYETLLSQTRQLAADQNRTARRQPA